MTTLSLSGFLLFALQGEMSLVNTEVKPEDKQSACQIFLMSFNGENSMLMEAATPEEAREWRAAFQQHIKFANMATEDNVSRHSRRVSAPIPGDGVPAQATSNTSGSTSTNSPRERSSTSASAADQGPAEAELSPDEAMMKLVDTFLGFFMDSSHRTKVMQSLLPTAQTILSSALESINAGEWGQRGERLLGISAALAAVVLIGFIPKLVLIINLLIRIIGSFLIAVGLAMILNACWELNDKFSVFLSPLKNTKVVTSGVYGVVRHPMYGGIILLCFGVTMAQQQVYKCFVTIALSIVLNMAAEIEEDELEHAFPKVSSPPAVMLVCALVRNTLDLLASSPRPLTPCTIALCRSIPPTQAIERRSCLSSIRLTLPPPLFPVSIPRRTVIIALLRSFPFFYSVYTHVHTDTIAPSCSLLLSHILATSVDAGPVVAPSGSSSSWNSSSPISSLGMPNSLIFAE